MQHVLYKTTNLVNGKFYIGIHSSEDPNYGTLESKDKYVGSGELLSRAIEKYGRYNFKLKLLCIGPTKEYVANLERKYVTEEFLKENHNVCYNMTPGGGTPPSFRGVDRGEEFRSNLSKSRKGMGNPMFGRHISDETRAKKRAKVLGVKQGPKKWIVGSSGNHIVQCPHCKKQGGKPAMKRWHFDNCKRDKLC